MGRRGRAVWVGCSNSEIETAASQTNQKPRPQQTQRGPISAWWSLQSGHMDDNNIATATRPWKPKQATKCPHELKQRIIAQRVGGTSVGGGGGLEANLNCYYFNGIPCPSLSHFLSANTDAKFSQTINGLWIVSISGGGWIQDLCQVLIAMLCIL